MMTTPGTVTQASPLLGLSRHCHARTVFGALQPDAESPGEHAPAGFTAGRDQGQPKQETH